MSLRIEQANRDFGLFPPGCHIVVALSGGADSVSLTHWLRFSSDCTISACHLNHSLRGEESLRDEEFVRTLCARWDIPLLVERADVAAYAKEQKCGLEEGGRGLRYAFFDRALAWFGADFLATAHTATDNLETLLLRLCRGTGLRGLCGIPPKRDRIIRPLLLTSRKEVEEYCAEHGLDYVTDSTNADNGYSRNLLRLEAVPVLRRLNPELERSVSRTTAILQEEEAFLAAETQRALQACREGDGLSCERAAALPPALRRRLLAEYCAINGAELSFERLADMEAVLLAGKGCVTVSGIPFGAERGVFSILLPPAAYFTCALLPGVTFLPDGRRIMAEQLPAKKLPQKVYKNLLYLYLDYDRINGKMFVRQRLPGDSIRLAGRGGTRTLKKLLNERKLSARQKSLLPVFADESGTVAVWGFGPDERVMLTGNTETVLRLALLPAENSDGTNNANLTDCWSDR